MTEYQEYLQYASDESAYWAEQLAMYSIEYCYGYSEEIDLG